MNQKMLKTLSTSVLILLIVLATATISTSLFVSAARPNINTNLYRAKNGDLKFANVVPSDGKALTHIDIKFTMNTSGWNIVTVSPTRSLLSNLSDHEAAKEAYYGAGFAEAYHTWEDALALEFNSFGSYEDQGKNPIFAELTSFFEAHIAWVEEFSEDNSVTAHALKRLHSLLKGYRDGINNAIDENKSSARKWDLVDMYKINSRAELGDIVTYISQKKAFKQSDVQLFHPYNLSHCSAMVKLCPATGEVFHSHTTWEGINTGSGIRIWRILNVETSVSFSSYPVTASSLDDFYVTGNKLMILETTLVMNNQALLHKYVSPRLALCFERFQIANIWANDTKTYSDLFLTLNSGTYNNALLILDAKLATETAAKNRKLPEGTFRVIEQFPGPYSLSQDKSDHLNKETYWPGYNVALLSDSKQNDYILADSDEHLGDQHFLSPHYYARSLIFARNHTDVKDLDSAKALMRYNGFQFDELSTIPFCEGCNPKRNPQLAISNRADLVDVNASFGNLTKDQTHLFGRGFFGGVDNKITSTKMLLLENGRVDIVNGPTTTNNLPPFEWKNAPKDIRHVGSPPKFDFPYVQTAASLAHSTTFPSSWPIKPTWSGGGNGDHKSHKLTKGEIAAVVISAVLIVVLVLWIAKKKSSKGDGAKAPEGGIENVQSGYGSV